MTTCTNNETQFGTVTFVNGTSNIKAFWEQQPLHGKGVWLVDYIMGISHMGNLCPNHFCMHAGLHVTCFLVLPNVNQKCNVLIQSSETAQYIHLMKMCSAFLKFLQAGQTNRAKITEVNWCIFETVSCEHAQKPVNSETHNFSTLFVSNRFQMHTFCAVTHMTQLCQSQQQ
jgi:hypothetical protein